MQTVTMRSILVAGLLSVAAVVPTAAQERAWFFSATSSAFRVDEPLIPPGLVEVNISNDGLAWSVGRRVVLPFHTLTAGPVFLGGGRYVVWTAGTTFPAAESVVVRFDTRSGEISILSLILQSTVALTVDPRSGRLVIADSAGIHFVEPGDRATITTWLMPQERLGRRSIAAGGDRLFLGRDVGGNSYTLILDASTFSLLGVIPEAIDGQVSPDERRFYVTRLSATAYDVETWDVETLRPVAHGTLDVPTTLRPKLVDDFFFTFWPLGRDLHVKLSKPVTAETAAEETLRDVSFTSEGVDLVRASSTRPFYLRVRGFYGSWNDRVIAVDPGTGRRQSIATGRFGLPSPATFLILAPPDPPARIRARTSGRIFTLEWDAPANVGDYEVIAGSAPGLRDIAVFRTGGGASLTVFDVPPGAYYVRVRAINELGSSASDEVLVIIR